jgi:isoquinoline 1-oxidoreductase beta subunit
VRRADLVEFRRAVMSKYPKHLAVLTRQWLRPIGARPPRAPRRGAVHGHGSYSAAVAEARWSRTAAGPLDVLALNCGHAVNPDQIAAQVEGSVVYGLSAAMYGEISIDKGRVVETNFNTYPVLRLAEMPKVETVLVPSFDFWGGVGEPTICVVSPAVLNAIFAATGKRVRDLPLKNQTETLARA